MWYRCDNPDCWYGRRSCFALARSGVPEISLYKHKGSMKKHRWSRERQQQFLEYLAETGNVLRAAKLVASSTARVYAMRHNDPAFRQAWDEAEELAADRLEAEAWRRAVEGVEEPAVNAGRLVRDEDGNAVMVRRYSDMLLLALLKAHRPAKFNTRL